MVSNLGFTQQQVGLECGARFTKTNMLVLEKKVIKMIELNKLRASNDKHF